MTASQKERISYMRLNGETYAAIADALGLSRNTVKSFCLRNIRRAPCIRKVNPICNSTCDQCGREFSICFGHRQRRFCSDHCRMTWWNAHRDLLNSKSRVEHVCASCGKPFAGYGRQQRKYCCHVCYIDARYGKK